MIPYSILTLYHIFLLNLHTFGRFPCKSQKKKTEKTFSVLRLSFLFSFLIPARSSPFPAFSVLFLSELPIQSGFGSRSWSDISASSPDASAKIRYNDLQKGRIDVSYVPISGDIHDPLSSAMSCASRHGDRIICHTSLRVWLQPDRYFLP